ncbi:MAG: UDP-N-acetylmuramate--L-alanine ligase [Deltaproteobacteria bacterium]|nr:UDP-N-acetylmuramate--L-alanine ligase [Deltaproteobacteria bacterium]
MKPRFRRFHFIGVGGIGMAALAELLHARGYAVTGTDLVAGATFERLRKLGLRVDQGHDASRVEGADVVVRSSAISNENPELVAARQRGLPIVGRGALLAELLRKQDTVAIAGSHGKTTTTAMTAHLLRAAGLDPTAIVGGRVPLEGGDRGPLRLGRGEWAVAEVDESDGSFLAVRPVVAVVTNADPEHLDYYGTRERLLDAFVAFANGVPFHGAAILGIDHPGIAEIAPRITARPVHFGFSPTAHVRAESIETRPGGQRCHVRLAAGDRFPFDLTQPGRHNVLNALAAIAVGLELDVPIKILADALASFPGVARRFERKGRAGGVEVVDDYAHHPTELRAALAAARSIHPGPRTAIFQPHRFTRTRDCWDDFAAAFDDVDRVVVCDIYPASEAAIPGIDSERLCRAIAERGHRGVFYGGSLQQVEADWPQRFEPGELVLTLGAGDVVALGPKVLRALERRAEDRA